MSWNPELYLKFQEERFEPFYDLFSLIGVKKGMRVIDLGCGTGELTSMLSNKLPDSQVLGVDSSPEMLEKAVPKSTEKVKFKLSAIEDISGEWDLIFSNAAIQWVPDHTSLIPRLISHLRPGGIIAVQLPSIPNNPTQDIIIDTGREEPFHTALGGWTRSFYVLKVREYAELLYNSGVQEIVAFEKVYPHILEDSHAMLDWLSATAALPYLERLPEELQSQFLSALGHKLSVAYPGSPVFYPFNRILFSARKSQ